MAVKIPLLQRYLFTEIVRVFVFVLSCITVLLVFVGVFQQATENGLGPLQVLKLLPFIIPSMLPFTIPAAMLLTVTVVYGRIAGDREVVAAKAAGIHPMSLMWPALLVGMMLSAGSFILTDHVIPWSFKKIEEHAITLMEDIFLERLRTEHQFSDLKHGLHVTVAAVDGQTLIHPVFRYVKGTRVVTIRAEEAQIKLDLEHQQALIRMRTGFIDIAGQGRVVFRGEKTEAIRWEREEKEKKPRHLPIAKIEGEISAIELSKDEDGQRQAIEALMAFTNADFGRLVETQAAGSILQVAQERRFFKLNTEVHSRYALACSCFFFALLGTPFSIYYGKSQFLTNFLLCFIPIICGYYPLMLGFMTQAKKGSLDPMWCMWVANVLLAIGALIVLRKVIRH